MKLLDIQVRVVTIRSEFWAWLKLCWNLWALRRSDLWKTAQNAVDQVIEHAPLQAAAQIEPELRFCPTCGQIPDGDRRMDQARAIVSEVLRHRPQPPRYLLDAAICLAYFVRKHER